MPAWDAPVLLSSVNGEAVGPSSSVTPGSGEGAASPDLRALAEGAADEGAEVVVASDGGVHGEAGGGAAAWVADFQHDFRGAKRWS